MEELDQIIKTASGIGALVGGAVSFAVTWGWKIWERRDRILVRFGSARYEETPAFAMHVISRRSHRMEVTDFGFVMSDGALLSLPMLYEHELPDEPRFNRIEGSGTLEELNQRFEVHHELGFSTQDVVGAFARTATQMVPTVELSRYSGLGWWRRQYVALRARHLRRYK